MENLENDIKKAQLLSDEELKEVAGGKEVLDKITLSYLIKDCKKFGGAGHCIQMSNGLCAWINNQCVPNPKKYEY